MSDLRSEGINTRNAHNGSQNTVFRAAQLHDAPAVATILSESFPALYRSTFGHLPPEEIVRLLTLLYTHGHLSLETTLLCEDGGRIVGLMILHIGQSIGRGKATHFARLMGRELGGWRALRALSGGLSANFILDRRIPRADDLVYIEALAVAESERGKGIGSHLLQEAERWAEERNRSRLALHVLYRNTGARRLYERRGFTLVAPLPPPTSFLSIRRSGWTALLMMKSLQASIFT